MAPFGGIGMREGLEMSGFLTWGRGRGPVGEATWVYLKLVLYV